MSEPVTLRADYGGRRERRRRGSKTRKGDRGSEREGERQSKEEPGTSLWGPGVSSSGWAVPGLGQIPTKHPKSLLVHFRAISADAAAKVDGGIPSPPSRRLGWDGSGSRNGGECLLGSRQRATKTTESSPVGAGPERTNVIATTARLPAAVTEYCG